MRRDERRWVPWSAPRFDRLGDRDLLSTFAGTVAGNLVIGPLAGKDTPPGDFHVLGSGSVHPLGRVHVSAITRSTSGGVPRWLTINGPRGFVRLEITSRGAAAPEHSVPVRVRIAGHSPGLAARTGERGGRGCSRKDTRRPAARSHTSSPSTS